MNLAHKFDAGEFPASGRKEIVLQSTEGWRCALVRTKATLSQLAPLRGRDSDSEVIFGQYDVEWC
jgi:hypothetical protein